MKSSYHCLFTRSFRGPIAALVLASALAAHAFGATPDPCKLVTVDEIEQIVGPLHEAPSTTDPESGENTCNYWFGDGSSGVSVSLEENRDLSDWKMRSGGESPVELPEFGDGAFLNPDYHGMAEVYVQKGSLTLWVMMNTGPEAVETVKAITRKALPRL